ncbi:MAG: type 1 glutamine amidotransferase [Acidimicrobiia bacterium]
MRVTVLYPDRLNLYADRGNLLVLEQRCRRRGLGFALHAVGFDGELDPAATDLVYLGGGQDRDQRACAVDLPRHREALARAVAAGATVLGICGGYQLLGHEVATPEGTLPGLGLLDVVTTRPSGPRLVGHAVALVDPALGRTTTEEPAAPAGREPSGRGVVGGPDRRVVVAPPVAGPPVAGPWRALVGFENHQGRTELGPGCRPLGRVLVGAGNNGDDGTEGAIAGPVIGTYLHGPLLAKNPWFADLLLEGVVGGPLAPVEDRFAALVHRRALAAALGTR